MATSNNQNGTSDESSFTVPLIFDGKDVTTKTTFNVSSPSTSRDLWPCSTASKEDALAAVESAQTAFPAWSRMKPAARRDILLRCADLFRERSSRIGQWVSQETGALDDVVKWTTALAMKVVDDTINRMIESTSGFIPVCEQEDMNALVYKEPYGVIFSIAPWNAPINLGLRAFIGAIATGNTCVLKGSELSPRTFYEIVKTFQDAGLPAGVLNLIYAQPADAAVVTRACIEAPAVKKITFTGSTTVGSIIAAAAGRVLKPTVMELGGKSGAIVCEDADLDLAAAQCALGAFIHSGQICMSTERIIVNEKVLEAFTECLVKTVDGMVKRTDDAPVLIQPRAVNKNHALISDAVNNGAKIVYGELNVGLPAKTRMQPIIIGDVQKTHRIYHEESFGPSVSIITAKSDEEAIDIANDTHYGLSSAVFSKDLAKALKIAKRIESGAVHINHMTIHDEPNIPHGGVKNSGWGRFNAELGINEFLRMKTISFSGVELN